MRPRSDPFRETDGSASERKSPGGIPDVAGIDDGVSDAITPAGELPRPADSPPTRPDLGPPAPGPRSTNQPGSGLGLVISVAVAAVVFAMAIYATGSATTNPLPLAQTTNALYWAVGVAVTIAAGIGAMYADRTASRHRHGDAAGQIPVSTAWFVPAVATATAVLLVATFHNQAMFIAGPLVAFLGNAGSLLSRDLLDDADDSAQRTATTIHALVIHGVAFLALSAIYLNKLNTLFTVLLVGIVVTLLASETFERSPIDQARKLIFSLLAAGTVAATAVPLMWWLTHGWTGGAVLFVAFYCAVGVIQTGIERRGLRPRDALEYGLVPLAALIVLAATA